jgi:hypothetical protein
MKYFGDIKVGLEEVVCLAIAELLQSPSVGEFKREEFVNGWKAVKYVCSSPTVPYFAATIIPVTLPPASNLPST